MIKSQISNNQNIQRWGLVFLAIAAAVSFRALILGKDFPSPLEIFIFYPTIIVSAFLVAKFFTSRTSYIVFRTKYIEIFLVSLGFGFLISLIPMWGDVAAAMPLSLTQIGTYLITLGVYPLEIGPGGLLRGAAWGLACVAAVAAYKENREPIKSIVIALSLWLGVSVVFLMPSLVLLGTMAANSLPISLTGVEMVKEFTRLSLFSYWNEGQLLRWFTGFGEQAQNSLLLYAASWVFVLGVAAWLAGSVKQLQTAWKGFSWDWPIGAAAIVYIGYAAGISGERWVGMDVAACLLPVVLLGLAWVMYRLGHKAGEGSVLLLWILGSALLGWPVFLGGLAFVFLIMLKDDLRGRINAEKYEWALNGAAAGLLMLLIVLFMRSGQMVELSMLRIAGMGLVFALAAGFVNYAARQSMNRHAVIAFWLAASVLIWLVSGVFAGTAIMLLAGVALWFTWHKISQSAWLPPALVWSLAIIVILLVAHLPRIAHPELLPR